jgi:hypothetical protein
MTRKVQVHHSVGATGELSLRVSLATLARVLFKHPKTGQKMLALERKATLDRSTGETIIEIKSQPFGGAIRINNIDEVQRVVGDFHFDSARSRSEADFRIFIRPTRWPVLREFVIEHLRNPVDPILETDPERELIEEFGDALNIHLMAGQFLSRPVGLVLEDHPSPTMNVSAKGYPSVRVYRVHEVKITDMNLAEMMADSSAAMTDQDLRQLALDDVQGGSKGRANAVLALPYADILAFYRSLSIDEINAPVHFQEEHLDGNVPAIFDDLPSSRYQRI